MRYLFLFFCITIGLYPSILESQSSGYIIDIKDGYSFDSILRSSSKLKSREQQVDYMCLSSNLNIWLVNYTEDEILIFSEHKAVESIQPNLELEERAVPDDSLFNKQWQYFNRGVHGEVDADIDLTEAWDITTGGKTMAGDEIVVAVIDGGANINHSDLKDNIWKNPGEIPDNGIDDDQNGFIDDHHGWNFNNAHHDISNAGSGSRHGTPVAGIIGAVGNNGLGVSGINWDVKIMNLVANRTIADLIQAYDYIIKMRKLYNETKGDKGAFIVVTNTSLGISNEFAEDHPIWCTIYDELGSVGVLNSVATTNRNTNIDTDGDMPTSCLSDFLIGVTNTTSSDLKELSAGYGLKHIDLGAPGSQVFTINNSGDYGLFGGTSAASPHVAGVIALLYSVPIIEFDNDIKVDPVKMALAIKDLILSNVDLITEMEDRSVSGGRLNAYKSIKALNELYQTDVTELNKKGFYTNVYPNPTHGIIHLYFSMSDQLSCVHDDPSSVKKSVLVGVFNQEGIRMIENKIILIDQGNHKFQFDMSQFPVGAYTVHVSSKDFAYTKVIKLIKY